MASARRATEGQAALWIPSTVEWGPKARVLVLTGVPLLVRVRGPIPVWVARSRGAHTPRWKLRSRRLRMAPPPLVAVRQKVTQLARPR